MIGTIITAIIKNLAYKDSYSSMSYKGSPLVEPPARGMLINVPMILGALSIPTSCQLMAHFMKIMMHMYPKVTERKMI
jgi:hypothetical protein